MIKVVNFTHGVSNEDINIISNQTIQDLPKVDSEMMRIMQIKADEKTRADEFKKAQEESRLKAEQQIQEQEKQRTYNRVKKEARLELIRRMIKDLRDEAGELEYQMGAECHNECRNTNKARSV